MEEILTATDITLSLFKLVTFSFSDAHTVWIHSVFGHYLPKPLSLNKDCAFDTTFPTYHSLICITDPYLSTESVAFKRNWTESCLLGVHLMHSDQYWQVSEWNQKRFWGIAQAYSKGMASNQVSHQLLPIPSFLTTVADGHSHSLQLHWGCSKWGTWRLSIFKNYHVTFFRA